MEEERTWFHQGPMRKRVEIGSIITTGKPHPEGRWKILEVHEEDVRQGEWDSPNYASLKLPCEDANAATGSSTVKAFMRVYVQILEFNTELEDSATRAAQGITYEPDELYSVRIK
jgi:hypothetical protein